MKEASSNFKPYLIEGFTGPMFSGKTKKGLLKRLDPLRFDPRKYSYIGIKPEADTRKEDIRPEDGFLKWNYVKNSKGIYKLSKDFDVIAIDEVQFFDKNIVDVFLDLQKQGKYIIWAGLNLDFKREPFGSVPLLMPISKVRTLHAICHECGEPAYYSQRLINGSPAPYNSDLVSIEGDSDYEPRCYKHHEVPGKD
jgi:thymidine kinase